VIPTCDTAAVRVDRIRENLEYGGLRLRTTASIGGARIAVTVDVAFGDSLEPGAELIDYPCLLDLPAFLLRAYARETVVRRRSSRRAARRTCSASARRGSRGSGGRRRRRAGDRSRIACACWASGLGEFLDAKRVNVGAFCGYDL
jgi:hypothetical protein